MTVNLFAVLALVLGIYLVYQVDKQKSSDTKVIYTFAGLIATIWGIMTLLGPSNFHLSLVPVAFALFAIATLYTKGATRAISGAITIVLFLTIVV